jgi:hypothetical protein
VKNQVQARMKIRKPSKNHWRAFYLFRFGMLVLFTAIPAQGAPVQRRPPPVPAPRPTPNRQPEVLTMRVDDGRVTATITNSPLQKVLQELAERTGVIFEVRSEDNPLVSVNLQKVSIPEAIDRIAPEFNTIFYYDKKQPKSERITLVQVFPRKDLGPQPSILYLGTGAVTKSNDDIETEEQALKILEEGTNVEVKEKAVEFLVDAKSDLAIDALIQSISDSEPEIRVAAIEGCAALNVQAALPNILKCLKDHHPAVRQSAATAVALLGTAQNLEDLKPLITDKDAGVAAAAETAVRKLSTSIRK